eukprot:712540-Pyramimonas_sp.AAC.1
MVRPNASPKRSYLIGPCQQSNSAIGRRQQINSAIGRRSSRRVRRLALPNRRTESVGNPTHWSPKHE